MARSRTRDPRIVVGATLVGAALSCQALVPFDGGDAPIVVTDAGTAFDPARAKALACGRPPAKPASASASASGDEAPMVFAVTTFGTALTGELYCDVIGVDFDSLDTARPDCDASRSCKPIDQNTSTGCDAPAGVDNAFARFADNALLTSIQLNFGAGTRGIETAVAVLVFVLTGYNGTADDRDVAVSLFATAGYAPADGGPRVLAEPGITRSQVEALPPVWDGTQDLAWIVDEYTVARDGGGAPGPRQTVTGYVRDGVLVVPELGPGELAVGLPSEGAIPYTTGTLSAFIDARRPRARLTHGRFSIRLPNSALLSVSASFLASSVCGSNQTFYEIARSAVCGHLDLPATGAPNDNSKYCRELSAGFAFTAVESKLRHDDSGDLDVESTRFKPIQPCLDAGKVFCDDCEWGGPRRCDAGAR